METQNLNLNSEMPAQCNDSKSKNPNKKINKAAQFAGGAALGVVGALAVDSLATDVEEITPEELSGGQNPGVASGINAESPETHAENVVDPTPEFDPNEIRLDEISEAAVGEYLPEPELTDQHVAMTDHNDLIMGITDDPMLADTEIETYPEPSIFIDSDMPDDLALGNEPDPGFDILDDIV